MTLGRRASRQRKRAIGGFASLALVMSLAILPSARAMTTGAITTIAGNGSQGTCPDGSPATGACIVDPYGVAADVAGNVFVADGESRNVKRIALDGTITAIAGNGGWRGNCPDGSLATGACLGIPTGVAINRRTGDVYIADYGVALVLRVSPSGTITTIAGNGSRGFCGDDGPATSACLIPYAVTVDDAGDLFVSDYTNHRVRRVNTDGIITTVAGNGTAAFCGDGGPAVDACIYDAYGLAVDSVGSLYIADDHNLRVRRVTTDGKITTIAGNGTGSYCGDGLPAASSCISPAGVTVDGGDNLFVVDAGNNRVERVGSDGRLTTVAGNGSHGFCGDGGPATSACLSQPLGASVDGVGNVDVADQGNFRVRQVAGIAVPIRAAPPRYLALGDSVPYGQGLANPTTSSRSGLPPNQGPSNQAYPSLVAAALSYPFKVRLTGCGLDGDQLAIAGAPASSANVTGPDLDCNLPAHRSLADELATANVIGHPPSLVTVQVGADDINFGDCLAYEAGVPPADYRFGLRSENCLDSSRTDVSAHVANEISLMKTALDGALSLLETRAPGAKIAVLNYYQPVATATQEQTAALFGADALCWGLYLNGNSYGDAVVIQNRLNEAIASVLGSHKRVVAVDIAHSFDGHAMCTGTPWVFAGTNDVSNPWWRAGHPNALGQAVIARAVETAIG